MIFYLSFADSQGFRGGAFVDAANGEAALWEATKQGLNLGGEALIVTVPLELAENCKKLMGRTVTEEDLVPIFGGGVPSDDVEELDSHPDVTIICEHHNPVKGGRA